MALAVGALAVAATVLSACGSSGGNGTTNNSNTGANTPATTSNTGSSTGSSAAQGVPSAYNAAVNNIVNPSTKTGGTLKLLTSSDCDSWDPARTYYGWCWNMQRLFTRSLIGYKVLNGTKFELAPDLATDMGTHNADFSQWTYTLKPGLKFSNGQPITAADVQWGVSRLWATDQINGGPASYFLTGIKAPKNYKGVYKDGPNTVGMTVTGSDKITFNLTGPNADFDYLMAMAASAPVPARTEGGAGFTGANYGKHPVASGPFMIKSYSPNKSIVFVRNPDWSQSTDTIHHPLVDEVDLTVDTNPSDIGQQLKAGTADGIANTDIDSAFRSQVLTNPELKKYADNPLTALTRYISVMPSVIPNVHCRRAIFYAFDKKAYQDGLGGPTLGAIAGSMTPAGISGYDANYNPYPSGPGGTPNVAKAKAELKLCGKPGGFSTKFAYATPSSTMPNIFKAEQSALAKVGIKVTAATQDASHYYSTFIGSPRNIVNQGLGMANAGWGADFPTGVGFYQSIANGNSIVQTGNTNYPSLNDPVVNKVLNEAPAGKATDADWETLNHQIMQDAVYLPTVWGRDFYYRNPRLTNITCDNALAFGIYDWVNVGVSS
jgi:peptide/nickel transport system substrate-binding protein